MRDCAVVVLDPDGTVQQWNPGAERLTGRPASAAVGSHHSTLYRPEDVAEGQPERDLAVAAASGSLDDEGWRLRADGSPFWAQVLLTAMRGDDGRLIGFGLLVQDLTERKRAEDLLRESEERFRLLVSSVADYAIFLLTDDGTVASWNLGAERLKGYQAEEILGQGFARFYTEDDRRAGVPDDALRQAREHGRWASEGWRVRRDGSRFWASVVITALRGDDGGPRGFAKVTRDLTDRKRSEDALRGVLDRERETAARLRDLDRMKNDLVSIIAHDLRGPVDVVRGLLHLVREEWSTADDGERLALVDRAAARLAEVADLVDDVFDLARIEAGELGVADGSVDLGAVVAQVVADAEVAWPDRRIETAVAPGLAARGDERRTWQVLSNLVTNALKFSPAETTVRIRASATDDEVLVAVEDDGPGIAADQHDLLFQRFVRLPQSTDTPGSGMGLFIARSLVEAQGGRMWVDSALGAGATFAFALPRLQAPS